MAEFRNRSEAGKSLAEALSRKGVADAVVYALPRGGVPVAAEVARALKAPLDVILVRKLGAPGQPELAIGAVADGDLPTTVLNSAIVAELAIAPETIRRLSAAAFAEIERRRRVFRAAAAAISPVGRTAIIVDDGLATGATMEVAVKSLRQAGARRIVVALPVAPRDAVSRLKMIADDVVCLLAPAPFHSVGAYYQDFAQLTDADVVDALRASAAPGGA